MVKVVGRAEELVRRVNCPNCASILEYTRSEIKVLSGTDYSGCGWVADYIDCPVCEDKVEV